MGLRTDPVHPGFQSSPAGMSPPVSVETPRSTLLALVRLQSWSALVRGPQKIPPWNLCVGAYRPVFAAIVKNLEIILHQGGPVRQCPHKRAGVTDEERSCVTLEAPLSMGFSRQEYWSGLPFPPPGDLPNLGIKPVSPESQINSLPSELSEKPLSCIRVALNLMSL